MVDTKKLLQTYVEIVQGYSELTLGSSTCFLKHPTIKQSVENEKHLDSFIDTAVEAGLDKFEDKLKFILEEGYWSQDAENEINFITRTIEGLKGAYKNEFIPSKKATINKRIKEEENKITDFLIKRQELIGRTAEDYAYRKLSDYFIINNFFTDVNFGKSFLTEEQYYEYSENITSQYQDTYNAKTAEFSTHHIKCIAALPFFQNVYYGCNDSVMDFFGKPVVCLTKYQTDLFIFGKNYSMFMRNSDTSKIPEETFNDPERFIELVEGGAKAKEILESKIKDGDGATAIFGATKADMKEMGLEKNQGAGNVIKAAKEKGGILEMRDIINLRGK